MWDTVNDIAFNKRFFFMTSKTPIVRQSSFTLVIPQLVAIAVAIFVAVRLSPTYGFIYGPAVYLLYSFGSRFVLAREHRAGVALAKRQKFDEAIPKFQKSLDFFDRFPWIDRFRSIILMSASAFSYREMALANIGFAYSQIGMGAEARVYYEKCLERFPNSSLATAALRMLNSNDPGKTA